jgi:hypothetical protein
MEKLDSNGNFRYRPLQRPSRMRLFRPRPAGPEAPADLAAAQSLGDPRRIGAGVYRMIQSAFGLVPSFLRRPEDAIAILSYRPRMACRA